MSLDWSIENCEDKTISEDAEWPITESVIFATMAVGMGKITEDNAVEFANRVALVQQINGAYLNKSAKGTNLTSPYYVTLEDVKKRIGLRTNVSNESHTAFVKRFTDANSLQSIRRRQESVNAKSED
jgi:hypothetical protein